VIGPAHLIVAIELCGSPGTLQSRIDRASQLVDQMRGGMGGPVAFSLLTYASHSHDRRTDDEPVTAILWAQTHIDTVERCLRSLSAREPAAALYPEAAQIECMLAEVARLLKKPDAAGARPVLVTIGNKPAFPHRIDPKTGIIPCPRRNDWRACFRKLAEDHAGMTFGAVRDDEDDDLQEHPANDIWRHLGTDANVSLPAFDAHRFAVTLGLLSASTQHLPLPLATPEELTR
jgi:hypothetical protein